MAQAALDNSQTTTTASTETVAPTVKPEPVAPVVEAPTIKSVKMELLKNYVPLSLLRVVGYKKDAVMQKNAAGQMVEVSPAAFIDGEMKPSVYPGTGFPNKIWAGTVIEVPEPEAKRMRQLKIAEAYI